MNSEVLLVDDSADWHFTENVNKPLVSLRIVFLLAFVIIFYTFKFEIEETGHCAAFVIAPQKIHVLGVFNFESQNEDNDFYAKFAPIDVISQEDVFVISRRTKLL
jgi:hypothetical protein